MPGKKKVARSRQLVAGAEARDAIRVLLFGDVVGKIGRRAVAGVLPSLRKRYQPTLVIANGENLAHGLGVTVDSLREMREAGVDVLTSGNNVWSKDGSKLLATDGRLLRPANYPASAPGKGDLLLTVDGKKILVINVQGRLYMHQQLSDPTEAVDAILKRYAKQKPDAIVVDYHAEATSEKGALAWYLDGRVSAVVGTHTHVQTNDARLLPNGTAFLTDLGMCGGYNTIIGTDVESVLTHQRTQIALKHDIPETGEAIVCGALIDVATAGRAHAIELIQERVTVNSGGAVVLKGKKQ